MIITVKYKSQLPNVIGNLNDSVFCIENGLYYRISAITKRPILNEKVSVTTTTQPSSPSTTEFAEIGSIRVDSATDEVYVCADNSDIQNIIWKNITSEVTHANITQKDSGIYGDGGHTNLIPRVVSSSNPTLTDYNYKIGTVWINTSTDTIFVIVDNTENNAIWNEYNKKYRVVSDEIMLNNKNMNTKIISLSNVNSNNIFTFQFTGNTQEYVIADIKLSVIEVVENTSVTVMAFTPNRYNGNITFKIIIN